MAHIKVVMDGYQVAAGDSVYDIVYGDGRVQELLADGRFVVQFPAGRRVTYNAQGFSKQHKARALYWRNPIVALPLKDDDRWRLVARLIAAVVTEVRH